MSTINIESITALLTTITVAFSTWAAFSAKKSAEAAQDQYNLSKVESEKSKLPLLIPIEFDYHTDSSRIDDTLDGNGKLDKKYGDLTINATNLSNAHAFNVVSYLNVRNLEEYLEFVSENPIEDIWFSKYQIIKDSKSSSYDNSISFFSIGVKNYYNDCDSDLSFYDARNAANAKMAIRKAEILDVSVSTYAQIILRDYLNRSINVMSGYVSKKIDPHLEVIFRFKSVEQLKTKEYTLTKYKVIFDRITFSKSEGITFRLMYEFDSEITINT